VRVFNADPFSLNDSCQTDACFTALSFSAKVSQAAIEKHKPGKSLSHHLVLCSSH
jgi:hypothetical protein